jgi:O-antigen ligase/thioredoxin-like negative regulator of GroEL
MNGTSSQQSITEKVAWSCLIAIAATVPLAIAWSPFGSGTVITTAPFQTAELFVLSILVAVAVTSWAIGILRGHIGLRSVPGIWWILVFFALAGISTLTALDPATALFGWSGHLIGFFTFLLCGATFLLGTQLIKGVGQLTQLARATVLAGMVVASIGLIQYLGVNLMQVPASDVWMLARGYSTPGNPDVTGNYLVVPFILAVILFLAERARGWRIAAWISTILVGCAMFVTLTRGAWIGALVGLAVAIVAAGRSSALANKAMLALFGPMFALTALLGVERRPRLVARTAELSSGWSSAGGGRLVLWRDALSAIARRPLFGVGADSYLYAWYPVRSLADVRSAGSLAFADDPHSLPLLLAATLGIPAALVGFGLVCSALWFGASGALARRESAERLVFSGWWAALAGLSLAMLFALNSVLLTLMVFLCLAAVVSPRTRPIASAAVLRYSLAGVGLILALGFVGVSSMTTASNYSMAQGLKGDSLERAQAALILAPWNYEARVTISQDRAEAALDALAAGAPDARELFAAADRATAELVSSNPHALNSYYVRTSFLRKAGSYLGPATLKSSVAVADAGIAVSPNDVTLRANKAAALTALGRPDEAATSLAGFWDADTRNPVPGLMYAAALVAAERSQEASAVLAELGTRFPNDTDVAKLRDRLAR